MEVIMLNNLRKETKQMKPLLGKSVLAFFILVFALTIPFWMLGAVTDLKLLPGLPVAALSTFCPMLAALILVYREKRASGAKLLLKRVLDFKKITLIWYAPILLLMPLVMVLSFGVMRLTGISVPIPVISIMSTIILSIVFFICALGEELGWSGYVIDPMQNRLGTLKASIILGLVWAIYHYIALLQIHRSVGWIAWWSLGTVAARVIIVWIYNSTGKSVTSAALFHMTINVTWQLFPISGSYYDPRISGSICALVAIIIIIIYRKRTLSVIQ
jgi:uncharacterized protein